jgi:hypothetical protein
VRCLLPRAADEPRNALLNASQSHHRMFLTRVCARGTFTVAARRLSVNSMEEAMGLGRGALLWLLGVPLPIIILLALFWHH